MDRGDRQAGWGCPCCSVAYDEISVLAATDTATNAFVFYFFQQMSNFIYRASTTNRRPWVTIEFQGQEKFRLEVPGKPLFPPGQWDNKTPREKAAAFKNLLMRARPSLRWSVVAGLQTDIAVAEGYTDTCYLCLHT